MNTKLPYNEVKEILERKKRQAEFKLIKSTSSQTQKKYEGMIAFYESTLYFLNKILNRHING